MRNQIFSVLKDRAENAMKIQSEFLNLRHVSPLAILISGVGEPHKKRDFQKNCKKARFVKIKREREIRKVSLFDV